MNIPQINRINLVGMFVQSSAALAALEPCSPKGVLNSHGRGRCSMLLQGGSPLSSTGSRCQGEEFSYQRWGYYEQTINTLRFGYQRIEITNWGLVICDLMSCWYPVCRSRHWFSFSSTVEAKPQALSKEFEVEFLWWSLNPELETYFQSSCCFGPLSTCRFPHHDSAQCMETEHCPIALSLRHESFLCVAVSESGRCNWRLISSHKNHLLQIHNQDITYTYIYNQDTTYISTRI